MSSQNVIRENSKRENAGFVNPKLYRRLDLVLKSLIKRPRMSSSPGLSMPLKYIHSIKNSASAGSCDNFTFFSFKKKGCFILDGYKDAQDIPRWGVSYLIGATCDAKDLSQHRNPW